MPFNFHADRLDELVWAWMRSFLTDPVALRAGLDECRALSEEQIPPCARNWTTWTVKWRR